MFKQISRSPGLAPRLHKESAITGLGMSFQIRSQPPGPNTAQDQVLAECVAHARPMPLRAFDQIPMRTDDLARQGRRVAPLLANQRVAFIGDMDGTASFLGLLAACGGPAPAELMVLDFDSRVLESAHLLAVRYGFTDLLKVQLYNCFDPVPPELLGQFDWFYTNPPYGSRNVGESARLFLTRGCELVRTERSSGCLILPDDPSRPWSRRAMLATQRFLHSHGWTIREKVDFLHRYHLDDDPSLSSSLIIADRDNSEIGETMSFAGRHVATDEIPDFFGRSTLSPYPRFIDRDGTVVGALAIL